MISKIVDAAFTQLITPVPHAIAITDLFSLAYEEDIIRAWHKSGGTWEIVEEVDNGDFYGIAGNIALEFVGNNSGRLTNLWAGTISPTVEPDYSKHPNMLLRRAA
jgi:hypothetical protein